MHGVEPASTLNLFATRPLGHCATCQGSSHTKNEYNLFYEKLDAEYFLIQQFFRKKQYFLRKLRKTVLGRIWQFFRERRRLVPKINITFFYHKWEMRYWIFYYLTVFFEKSCNFLRKRQKIISVDQVSFEGKEASGDENEYNLFLWEIMFWIFFHLTIFSKKQQFWRK